MQESLLGSGMRRDSFIQRNDKKKLKTKIMAKKIFDNRLRENFIVNGINITFNKGKYYINNSDPIPEKAIGGIITVLQTLIERKIERVN